MEPPLTTLHQTMYANILYKLVVFHQHTTVADPEGFLGFFPQKPPYEVFEIDLNPGSLNTLTEKSN